MLRRGQPVWLDPQHRPAPTRYPRLRGHHHTEVAIVGGGLTGAMTAATFAEAGIDVAVVEARRAGLGSTAASTALLLQEPDYDLTALGRKFGPARARRIWQIGEDTTRDCIALIRRLDIECGLEERDSIYYTLSKTMAESLRREIDRRLAAGLHGDWLEGNALRRRVGLPCAAAICTRGNAQLHPLRACHGLLAAAVGFGGRVFEHSAVSRIRRVNDRVRLYCADGTIEARQVVIATGYATKYFKPLAGRFKMRHTYVLMTEPIGWLQRRRLGLADCLMWDTERPYHYVRWTRDHRLLLGGEDRPVKPGANRSKQFTTSTRELRDYFNRLLPGFSSIRIARAWEGLFAMTPDGLPYIGPHRRYPGHTFALGYGGNGMTFAALAARILLEQWRGIASADHRLFAFDRRTRRR